MATDETGASREGQEVKCLRATERQRLHALVAADVDVARRLHADDFQLVNPSGRILSKTEYLEGVASGFINYLAWEPGAIAVRLHGQVACLRYRAHTEIIVGGHHAPKLLQWHTDFYERRDGRWQVVWSQATAVAPGTAADEPSDTP